MSLGDKTDGEPVSTHEQPAPAYGDVDHPNDPGAGAAIAKEAPAESETLSSATDERAPEGGSTATGRVEVPGSADGDIGLPVGSTDIPAADTGRRRGGDDVEEPLRHGLSGRAGSDPDEWPANDRAGVSGRAPGPADLENPGGTGLTTADTEGGDR